MEMRLLGTAALLALSLSAEMERQPGSEQFKQALRLGEELQARGRPSEARHHFADALRQAEALGPASEVVASAWLGSVLIELGRLSEAEKVLTRNLALQDELRSVGNYSGAKHAVVLSLLGTINQQQRRDRQAERRFEQALIIWQGMSGGARNPEFAAVLNNVAMLRYNQGRFRDAERYLREAVAIFGRSVPDDDRRLVQAMAHLAGVLSRLGLHADADAFSNRAMAAFTSHMDREPLVAVRLLSIRADILRKTKRDREATPLEVRARHLSQQAAAGHVIDLSVLGAARTDPRIPQD